MFFANYVSGIPIEECADNDGHNTDAIDALTLTVPIIILYAEHPREVRNKKIQEVISTTRKSQVLLDYAIIYSDILVSVLNGNDLKSSIEEFGSRYDDPN